MIVYGDPSFELATRDALSLAWAPALRAGSRARRGHPALDEARALLVATGQVEQALADGLPGDLPPAELARWTAAAASLTDRAAAAFLAAWNGPEGVEDAPAPDPASTTCSPAGTLRDRLCDYTRTLAEMRDQLSTEGTVRLKVPEGFAFYALYPEQYAAAALRWMADHAGPGDRRVIVVGIRSIGTSLSAIVAATLASRGRQVHRVTVRPTGHPYDRTVALGQADLRGAAHALVVDEGPGQSGSSMAAVARALAGAGLASDRVSFLPGHGGEPGGAASDSVRAIWAATRRYVVPPDGIRWGGRPLPGVLATQTTLLLGGGAADGAVERVEDLSGGLWRRAVYRDGEPWPPAWPAFERTKYRCVLRDGRSVLWKFAGLAAGPYGRACNAGDARLRLRGLAEGGWTPAPLGTSHGFVATPWLDAGPMSRRDAGAEVLSHMGRYVAAARGPELGVADRQACLARLREMLFWNTWESLGEPAAQRTRAWADAAERTAPSAAPVPSYGDGRMAPHEWLHDADGRLWKVDCVGHDTDHTAVGPQPVAWDVAGALVEWGLEGEAAGPLLGAYRAAGGAEIPDELLAFYRMAYAAFRVGMCSMCAGMLAHDPDEQARLRAAEAFYRDELSRRLESSP